MTWKELSRLGRELPGVVEGIWFRRLKAPKALVKKRDAEPPVKTTRRRGRTRHD
jgi:hypothetical protein